MIGERKLTDIIPRDWKNEFYESNNQTKRLLLLANRVTEFLPQTLRPNVIYLRYFKLGILLDLMVLNFNGLHHQVSEKK